MAAARLPDGADLDQLRKQAKDLRDLARAGVPGALALVAEHHPRGAHPVSLAGAQLVVARHYGFTSWPRLKHHVEVITEYRREPDEVPAHPDPASEFLRLACLRYGGDDPQRWRDARRLLAGHPGLARASIHVAAAACDREAAAGLLRRDPGLAGRQGGPYRWEPLLYLAYARHDPEVTAEAAVGTARLLLDHGADPNAGYLWHGMAPPFTVLTGVFASGEGGGDEHHPEHPQAMALAALLLERGADPNDGQALYNRQFGDDDRHLVLLLRHGLGRGDGGPWRARLGRAQDSPAQMTRQLLWWAIVHDQRARVRLLTAHGTDITSPYPGRMECLRFFDGRTPAEVAALCGHADLLGYLVAQGAAPPRLTGPDALVAACLRADRPAVAALSDQAAAARAQRPGLIAWAAASGKHGAIPLLAGLGWDVNALGRTDAPAEQPWETALHYAAGQGDTGLTRLLLSLGADPAIPDARFDSTPLGWARHFGRAETAALLAPLTP
jgi:ankyrin repeat protein